MEKTSNNRCSSWGSTFLALRRYLQIINLIYQFFFNSIIQLTRTQICLPINFDIFASVKSSFSNLILSFFFLKLNKQKSRKHWNHRRKMFDTKEENLWLFLDRLWLAEMENGNAHFGHRSLHAKIYEKLKENFTKILRQFKFNLNLQFNPIMIIFNFQLFHYPNWINYRHDLLGF